MKIYYLVVLVLLLLSNVTAWAGSEKLQIIYVSKMTDVQSDAGKTGGIAELGSLVKNIRKNSTYSLFLHGGDFLAPSTLSSFDHGTHMIDILNSLVPEVVAVNEREFAFKEDEFVLRVSEAAFPFVASNVVDPLTGRNLEGLTENQCFDFAGKNICVFGMLDPNVSSTYLTERILVDGRSSVVKEKADKLRASGADFVILMASYSIDGIETMLKDGIIDLVLESSEQESAAAIGSRYIVKQGGEQGTASIITLDLGSSGIIQQSFNRVNLIDYPADHELSIKINYYLGRLAAIMDVEIGKTSVELNTAREFVRSGENAFANLIADALREYYKADTALINGGTIRGNRIYKRGYFLTRRDIQGELPFRNQSTVISVSGSQIVQSIENGLSTLEEIKGRFPHVSGMSYVYCSKNEPGKRVRGVFVNGKAIDVLKKYSLATVDYLADGGDGYSMLKLADSVRNTKTDLLLWEVVREYIASKKNISPVIEGRIIDECRE